MTEILRLLLAYCILLSYICIILANKQNKTIYFCKKHQNHKRQIVKTAMKLYELTSEYTPLLDLKQTELAIKQIKEVFQLNLSSTLRLRRVTAPLFVLRGTGLNDDLNGYESAVSFPIQDMSGAVAEVVHSLAKWKRVTLADYRIPHGYGIYTDMNAIRAHEELDNLHSLYVDQWDWERVISEKERTVKFLGKEREEKVTQEHGAVFIIGIGDELGDGTKHDNRAPDYDDYSTPNEDGFKGLNGDLLIWSDLLGKAVELSSMGIRVDREALLRQLEESGKEERKELYFHRRLLAGELPLCIGGGIGQSRLCMLLLKKAHIGEIQSSIWPKEMRDECRKMNIPLI